MGVHGDKKAKGEQRIIPPLYPKGGAAASGVGDINKMLD
jgi:hypothetical protein